MITRENESITPVHCRYLLDIKEAAEYYHIGEKKLREWLISMPIVAL